MWPNPQFPSDLVTFTEEILNEKLHFCAELFYLPYLDHHGKRHKVYWNILDDSSANAQLLLDNPQQYCPCNELAACVFFLQIKVYR